MVAFTGVNVLPMDREVVLEDHTVIVEDDRITAVGPADEVEIPEGAQRIDGAGRWLMPGLAEMHGHVPGPDDPGYAEDVLFLYVSNGVTTVRNMAGHAYHLELRERLADGDLLGPTLFTASPWLNPDKAGTSEAAEQAVREYEAAGFDLVKLGNVPPEAYGPMAETAHAIGMPFGGHIPDGVGLGRALEARQTSIDHLDRYAEFLVPDDADTGGGDPGFFGSGWAGLIDTDRIPEAVRRTLEAGTWNVPTLSLVEHLASPESPEAMIAWPEMRYMPQEVRDSWVRSKHEFAAREDFQPEAAQRLVEVRRQLLKALHDGGAPIALGSDAPQFFNVPGFSIHHEMEMMVAAGLTPYEVLVTGTRNPAAYFGTPDAFGTVEPGRRADLILLEANPLEDVANVQRRVGVMVRGQWLPEEMIQARLEEIAAEIVADVTGP
ncbi:amidohydrolase family protein [Luteimonas suaedae]|uniref:amidohydrolase family protein n=1 Tax=Luteimonas suaedae TaxID=2605430 RepID=UPI001659FBA7|nr:amidohydrolase family protein [Luteimonas suaedae]